MNKKAIGVIFGLIILIFGYLYASPYIILNSIKNALKENDSEKVSAYIDYTSVRQSLKDQMNAYMLKEITAKEANGWEALGAMMVSTLAEKMVDAVVTPEGMTLMLQGKDLRKSLTGKREEEDTHKERTDTSKIEYRTRYLSMSMFEVTFKNKENGSDVKIIMERDGLSWKIKKIVLPMDEINPKQKLKPTTIPTVEKIPESETSAMIEPTTIFNFSGVQKGAKLESCYHDPCSIIRVMEFKLIKQTPTESNIELSVVGGSRGWDAKKIEWNHEAHKIQIQCSITKPTLQIEDEVTIIPLNDSGVPGVLWSDAETYMQACHNYTGDMGAGIQQYGYNVQDS
ncbi:DUF2939 domain-containing protein [Acinetobacter pittii]|uniref:DUF2939 domain-containing protein n=2 Tax=Acinetobacter pittii TaxID=48296 RepID=UPI000E6AD6BF|nr:DUF2939 domain-containing protein [Acinetobacter pittii]